MCVLDIKHGQDEIHCGSYMINLSSCTRKSAKCGQENCSWSLIALRMVRTQFYGALNLAFLKLHSINHHTHLLHIKRASCDTVSAFVFHKKEINNMSK